MKKIVDSLLGQWYRMFIAEATHWAVAGSRESWARAHEISYCMTDLARETGHSEHEKLHEELQSVIISGPSIKEK